MSSVKKFEDLEVWKNASELAIQIYQLTLSQNFKSDFSLRDQIRRSAISTSSNIAEGFEYGNNKDFIRFLKYSKGSAGELRSLLFIISKLELIEKEKYVEINSRLLTLSKQISSFIKYLQNHIQA